MSYSIPVVPRSTQASAFQLVLGETTATQIREFAGAAANVGVSDRDERDLRWVAVKAERGWTEMASGDWIVKDERGVLDVVTGEAFHSLYAGANDEARSTLRVRDINDPRVEADKRLAANFSASLSEGPS